MKYQSPKGTADILPSESAKWQYVEEKARELFKKYRYEEMRTPIFESFEVHLVKLQISLLKKCMISTIKVIVI